SSSGATSARSPSVTTAAWVSACTSRAPWWRRWAARSPPTASAASARRSKFACRSESRRAGPSLQRAVTRAERLQRTGPTGQPRSAVVALRGRTRIHPRRRGRAWPPETPMSRLLPPLLLLPALAFAADPATLPITTSSAEARALYLEGRDLLERLKATEGHLKTDQAVKKDPQFALAWLQWANTSGTAKEFQAGLDKAVANASHASEAEQKFIKAAEAGARSRPAEQERLLAELEKQFPNDARIQAQIGIVAFARQDYDGAVRSLARAVEIDPKFTLPYNQLGYAYRAQGKNAEAEKTFKKYAELIPDDPNPHDSYAELLMRLGRYDESIGEYKKALQIDPYFLSAYVGIANNQIFAGKGDDARATLKQMMTKTRNDGEKRQVWFWTSETYAHEERWPEAIKAIEEEKKIADASGDLVSASQDVNFIGNLLLASGKPA